MAFLSIAIYPVSLFADHFGADWAVGISGACLTLLTIALAFVPSYRNLD